MATATLQDNSLLPQAPGGNAAGAGLAVLVHVGLVAALTLSVDWRTHAPDVVSAELWAAVPQVAAPRAPEPVPQPAPAPPPPAPAPPPPQPVQQQRDADIAIEREQQRKKAEEERKKAQAEAERKKAEDEKKRELAQKEKERDRKEREQKEHAAREAQAAEERLAQQREENLRRMMGQAGGSGGSGTAARDAAPSATYAGRVVAAVRRNIVFTGAVADEAVTEVDVRTGAGGTIISARMTKSSGNKDWDDAVVRAIEKTGRLPADVDGRVPSSLQLVFRPRE